MLTVMRLAWTGEPFFHHGERFHYDDVRVRPAPKRMDVWLGGRRRRNSAGSGVSPTAGCRRSSCRATSRPGRAVIESVAAEHDRAIEDDHYGVLIPYAFGDPGPTPGRVSQRSAQIFDVSELVPTSWDELMASIKRFIDVGTSKFVVLPSTNRRTPMPGSATSARPLGALAPRSRLTPIRYAGHQTLVQQVGGECWGGREPNASEVTSNTHDATDEA